MAGNLCWICAESEGFLTRIDSGSVLATTYQLDKFIKHTQPKWVVSGINSLFTDPSTGAYANYVVTSLVSGSVALDQYMQPTFIWYAGGTIGATYVDGVYQFPNDAVKVVLPFNDQKIHAYSVSSTGYNARKCSRCGTSILG
jgi:hypothetical protein